MNNLGGILSIFENLLKQEEVSLRILEDVFQEVLGVRIDSSAIKAQGFAVYVDTHPVIRNEILLKQDDLVRALRDKTGRNVDQIR